MNHQNAKSRLGRTTAPRKALVRNLLTSLVLSGAITTTKPRAKVLVARFDELVTGIRRQKELREKIRYAKQTLFTDDSQRALFDRVLPALEKRTSGFTRSTLLGPRKGDGSEQVHIEICAS